MEAQSSVVPWHMWGTHATLDLPAGAANVLRASQQLGRIEYKRPETWSFFLGARIVAGVADPANPIAIRARINLLFGVGRSVFDTKQPLVAGIIQSAFAMFTWQPAAAEPPPEVEFANKYTTRVQSPPMAALDLTTTQAIDWIPAQDIQVESDVEVLKVDPAVSVRVQVYAFFAPRSHVRADWFNPNPNLRFLGGEAKGR